MLIQGILTLLILGLGTMGIVHLMRTSWVEALVWLSAAALAYLVRHIARTNLPTFDDFLQRVAGELEETLEPTHTVPYIVMGHDHIATIEKLKEAWYVNTGTWVQIFEQKGPIEGREKLTFFLHAWGYRGTPELMRWDDAAGEPARLMFGLTD